MPSHLRIAALAALACAVPLLGAAPASASKTQESIFQDDVALLYGSDATLGAKLNELKALGVDRVRVDLRWADIAPATPSSTFNPRNPDTYPPGAWYRYDRLVNLTHQRKMGIDFTVSSPAPSWASQSGPGRAGTNSPDADQYGAFVTALGKRYSGQWYPGCTGGPEPKTCAAGPGAAPLPRVNYWSFWNEPNQAFFLTPQYSRDSGGRTFAEAPHLYRDLVRQGYQALGATGHWGDTILIPEVSAKGNGHRTATGIAKPLDFIRNLYCVDRRLQPLTGAVARDEGCPAYSQSTRFPASNPALFRATGASVHPYSLFSAPDRHSPDPDFLQLADLQRLPNTLSAIFRRYPSGHRSAMAEYLTEYGYETNIVSAAQQAAYINQAEYMTYRNRSARTMSQFLLVDRTNPGGFRSGLEYGDGSHKQSYDAYRLPIYVPQTTQRRGHRFEVWGLLRAAPNATYQKVGVRIKRRGSNHYQRVGTVTTGKPDRNPRGYLDIHLRLGGGLVQLAWYDPNPTVHKWIYSRSVAVRVR